MKRLISIMTLLILSSCTAIIPDLFKSAENIEIDTELHIKNKEKHHAQEDHGKSQ